MKYYSILFLSMMIHASSYAVSERSLAIPEGSTQESEFNKNHKQRIEDVKRYKRENAELIKQVAELRKKTNYDAPIPELVYEKMFTPNFLNKNPVGRALWKKWQSEGDKNIQLRHQVDFLKKRALQSETSLAIPEGNLVQPSEFQRNQKKQTEELKDLRRKNAELAKQEAELRQKTNYQGLIPKTERRYEVINLSREEQKERGLLDWNMDGSLWKAVAKEKNKNQELLDKIKFLKQYEESEASKKEYSAEEIQKLIQADRLKQFNKQKQ